MSESVAETAAQRYVDLQVNGYAGVDFNSDGLVAEDFRNACDRLRRDGVSEILATVITDDLASMERRLSAIVTACESDSTVGSIIRGIHIEGPFLNETPGYIGAHPVQHAKPANLEAMQRLLDAANGMAQIVTLAPERDAESKLTRWLSDQGIVVSAGHCDPSADQLKAAIDSGLSMFTHLGNGCPLLLHRHDNIIQRVLNQASHLMIGFIADGVHVPLAALRNYIRCAGIDRAFVVTDAIAAAGQGPGTYELAGQTVVVDDNLATWAPDRSHLIGSASTMPSLVSNLNAIGLGEAEIQRLTSTNPLRVLGLTA